MNVSELARKMNVTKDEFLAVLAQRGIDIGRKAIKVNPKVAEKIVRMWERGELVFEKKTRIEEQTRSPKQTAHTAGPIAIEKRVRVSELAAKLHVPVTTVITELMKNGVMATINQDIDFETAQLVGEFLGATIVPAETGEEEPMEATSVKDLVAASENGAPLTARPPVVVIMGHVDHGKTTLLDRIRESHVAAGETGGITQHIGAYQIERQGKLLTFLDTPGHEAFRAMRTRGGKVADIAILVVAANDGVQPQTREAIQIIKQEKLPLIVAINKTDAPGSEPDRVKRELAELGLQPEDWGGSIPCVLTSAKVGEGVDNLLETILVMSEVIELKANAGLPAIGTIIESHRDSGEGSVATVLVHAGTLHQGDNIIVGDAWGTVRALKDEHDQAHESVGPGSPAQILGLKAEPTIGDILQVIADRKEWRAKVKEREGKVEKRARVDIAQLRVDEQSGIKTYNVILKSDVLGSEEALIESLLKIRHPEVALNIIDRGLGNITDSDVLQAEAAGASVLAFRVRATPTAEELASEKHVPIHSFEIIYGLIDHVKEKLQSLLAPEVIREDFGKLKILALFREEPRYTIAGGVVTEGKLVSETPVEVWRDNVLAGTAQIEELQSAKEKVSAVPMGSECGIRIKGKTKLQVNDILLAYREEKKERRLE